MMADPIPAPDLLPPLVRRPWCVKLALCLLVFGAILNTFLLFNNCPLDLTGDEAHYWQWSRHIDYGYYSKPPGIAWVIWLALRVGALFGVSADAPGETLMPVMRMAAVVFGIISGLLSLSLARRIFRDDRAALAVIVLSAAVPMFAIGSVLITIDSPMYLCWASTVYCIWLAIEKDKKAWLLAAGFFAALGMLCKPVLIALPISAIIAALADRPGGIIRRTIFSRAGAVALIIMLSSYIPVFVWNSHHDWVMFKHIGTQGFGGGPAKNPILKPLSRLGEYTGAQAGGMGGILFVLLAVSIWAAWQKCRRGYDASQERVEGRYIPRTRWVFLLSFMLPLWGFFFIMNLWKETEPNWPAASYFTGMILLAGIFVEGWNSTNLKHRKTWRTWGTAAITVGVLGATILMNAHRLYPLAAQKLQPLAGKPEYFKSPWHPGKWERPIWLKLRGMEARAQAIEKIRQEIKAQTGQEPLIISGRYDDASSLSFYLPGHPFVYCIMSSVGGRRNQYDFWPSLNDPLDGIPNQGRPAIIIGDYDDTSINAALKFDTIGPKETLDAPQDGMIIKQLVIRRALGFRKFEPRDSGVF